MTASNIIKQDSSKGEILNQSQPSAKNNITSPGIVNIFKSSITPPEISYVASGSEQSRKEITNGLGYMPVVWYNNHQIEAESINFLSIYTDVISPAMKINFLDTLGLMKDKAFPLDDAKITLFLNSRSDQLKSIFIQFKIRTFTNNNGVFSVDCIMDVDGLYIKKFKSYSSMTSNQALQEICKDIGLGFNTNITDTNDKMTWINSGKKPYDFIEEVIDHSYISDESFVYGYIDHYYNLNFIDIQKELSRDISNELGVVSTNISDILQTSKEENVGKLLLTNDASVIGSNIYFESCRIINSSTETSLESGYRDVLKYYDILDKSLLNFKVDSLNNNADNSIILKGSPLDDEFYNNNQNFIYGGKIDTDNLHKNFSYTKTLNNRNIIDAQKIGMEIELPSPNYNIYRFQKIRIMISSNTATPSSPMINQRLSGDWLIVDIRYILSNKSLKQVVTLIKRELELSEDELNNESISRKSQPYDSGRGSYDNPVTTSTTSITTTLPPLGTKLGRIVGTSQIPIKTNFHYVVIHIIDNLEGGYYHPDMGKKNPSLGKVYGDSGETMFGMDRKHDDPKVTNSPSGREFWSLIDKSNARLNWPLEFGSSACSKQMPKQTSDILKELVVKMMEPVFNSYLNTFIPKKDIQNIIRGDGRLLYNFVYATFNGRKWFNGWANEIRSAYHSGPPTPDKLTILFVGKRIDNTGVVGNIHNNSLIAQTGRKIAKFVGVDIA